MRQSRRWSLVAFEYVEGKETPWESGLLTSLYELEVGFSDRENGPSGLKKRDEKTTEGSREVKGISGK